ncbi:MAG: phosphate ABC transporter substrate-binding protein PstS family protein [Phototrophicaceae bacterium]|jgi:phosphate transport system substrate-binding protein
MKNRVLALLAVLMLVLPFVGVMAQDQTIVEIAAGNEDFSTLVAAVTAAGLAETLSGGEFTVFAPTNEAFDALFAATGLTVEDLVANTDLLTTVLTYHVVAGTVLSTDLVAGEVASVEGSPLTVHIDDMGVMIDQANVVTADIVASNGVIHVIDSVLLTLPVDPATVSGDIAAAGSSTVFPLLERLKDEFETAGYAGTLAIDSIGTGGGFERFCTEGASDIANASRAIRDNEIEACTAIEREPIEFRLGTDALAIVVSSENDFLEDVTLAELALIFGEATNWSDVNSSWPAEPIQRFVPDDASGTFDYFVEVVFEEDPEPIRSVNPTQSSDDNVLVQGVQSSPYAIGFFGYAYYQENDDVLRAIAIEGVEPTAEAVDAAEYPLARPLFVYSTASIIAEKPQVGSFLAFALSDVNAYIGDVGYFNASAASLYEAKLALIGAMLGM